MNVPTLSSPWFVLQKLIDGDVFYYPAEGDKWTTNIKNAFFFLALKAASRIADEEKSDVMVLYSKGQIKGWEDNE